MATFVKSRYTKASVESSRAELNKVLSRYGCTAFGYEEDADAHLTRVTFRVPNSPEKDAAKVPVRLEVRTADVYKRMYGRAFPTTNTGYYAKDIEQAEKVAWRHLILWIDAACTAATAGITTIEEAFFAHRLVRGQDGGVGRVIDYMHTMGQIDGGPRLLGSGGDSHV